MERENNATLIETLNDSCDVSTADLQFHQHFLLYLIKIVM